MMSLAFNVLHHPAVLFCKQGLEATLSTMSSGTLWGMLVFALTESYCYSTSLVITTFPFFWTCLRITGH